MIEVLVLHQPWFMNAIAKLVQVPEWSPPSAGKVETEAGVTTLCRVAELLIKW